MFSRKKEELNLGQFMNMSFQAVLTSKLFDSLPSDITLTKKEVEKFKHELLFLRVELLMAHVMEIGKFGSKAFTNEEIGKTTGIAMSLALRDTGHSKSEIEKILDETIDHIGDYEDYLTSIDEQEYKRTGMYFQILQQFTNLVLGKDKKYVLTEEGRNKSFEVFSFGKQVYKNDDDTFKEMYKSVKFID